MKIEGWQNSSVVEGPAKACSRVAQRHDCVAAELSHWLSALGEVGRRGKRVIARKLLPAHFNVVAWQAMMKAFGVADHTEAWRVVEGRAPELAEGALTAVQEVDDNPRA